MGNEVLKWKVRGGPGTTAIQTYQSGQGPVSSPISVDEAGYKAAGGPQGVVYNAGNYITTGVYRVVGNSDPSLNIRPGDMVASVLGWPFPFADQLGMKSPSQYTNSFWAVVDPANDNPNVPGSNPNVPPGNNPPPVPGQLPPGAVGRDQWGRAVDQYGRVVPENGPGVVYVPPPPPAPTGLGGLGIDPNLFLMLSQQGQAAAERAAAREDAAMRAEAAAEERDEERRAERRREEKAEREERELRRQRQEQELAAQRAMYAQQGIPVPPPNNNRNPPRRRRRRDDEE